MFKNDEILQITTREFLNKYFDKLMAISGRNNFELLPDNLKHYQFCTGFNATIMRADILVYCVGKAFNECQNETKKPYRTILIDYYLKEMWNSDIANEVGYSHSRFGILKKQALDEFTQRFNYWTTKQGVKPLVQLVNK